MKARTKYLLILAAVLSVIVIYPFFQTPDYGKPDLPPNLPLVRDLSLNAPLTEAQYETLSAIGVDILGYHAQTKLQISLPESYLKHMETLGTLTEPSSTRAADGLLETLLPNHTVPVFIKIAPREALPSMEAYLRPYAKHLYANPSLSTVECELPSEFIRHLLNTPELPILHISTKGKLQTFSAASRSLSGVGLDELPGLTGAGEMVAVIDDALGSADRVHPDIHPALYIGYSPPWTGTEYDDEIGTDIHEHGSHVCGIVAAQGEFSPQVKGMAPHVKLYFQRMGIDTNEKTLYFNTIGFEHARRSGANIISCSWGGQPSSPYYSDFTAALDDFVWHYPNVLLVFAVGNGGNNRPSIQAQAKNIITVGHTTSSYDTLGDYSNGGTNDGRHAPLLLAPGENIQTLNPETGICSSKGSSMAAPMVSGTAACLRQFLREQHRITAPSSALVRAAILLMTEPFTAQTTKTTGFGKFVPGQILSNPNLNFRFEDNISLRTGSSKSFSITIPEANAKQADLFITLSWLDPPSEARTSYSTEKCLINDYNLTLTLPDGTTLPETEDNLNTNESIRIPAADLTAGTYTVKVSAKSIQSGTARASGNIAALAIRAPMEEGKPFVNISKPTPEERVTLTTIPHTPLASYAYYSPWPPTGVKHFRNGDSVSPSLLTSRLALELATNEEGLTGYRLESYTFADDIPIGWTLTYKDGTIRQGTGVTAPTLTLDQDATFRWHTTFPGATFRLK